MRAYTMLLAGVLMACGGGGGGQQAVEPVDPARVEAFQQAGQAPPPRAQPEVADPQKLEMINRHFRMKTPLAARCYADAVQAGSVDEAARGQVMLALDVDPQGAPKNVRVASSSLKSPVVETCLVELVKSFALPHPGVMTPFSFSYAFAP